MGGSIAAGRRPDPFAPPRRELPQGPGEDHRRGPGPGSGPGPDAVEEARRRLLAADLFRRAPQLTAFLDYVVTRALEGDAASLKGYTIATQALGRGPDFDPATDPIVRVEAGRLRRALDAYYATAGRDDPVRISVPRGGYAPAFAWNGTAPAPGPGTGPGRGAEGPSAPADAPTPLPREAVPRATAPREVRSRGAAAIAPLAAAALAATLVALAGALAGTLGDRDRSCRTPLVGAAPLVLVEPAGPAEGPVVTPAIDPAVDPDRSPPGAPRRAG